MKKGIDISQWNGNLNWKEINTDFVYIKACTGVNSPDPLLHKHVAGAKSRGIPYGFYHFSTINSANVAADANSEANYFHELIKNLGGTLSPVLDVEESSVKMALTQEQHLIWMTAFLTNLEVKGYHPTIYSYAFFLNSFLPKDHYLGKYPLWLAQYPWDKNGRKYPEFATIPDGFESRVPNLIKANGWAKPTVWQYTGQGKCQGIKTHVDLNIVL
jgi:lysozyme